MGMVTSPLKFNYNAHWRSWSRVLSFDPATKEFVEVNLTHINGQWDRAASEWIRIHRMPRRPMDRQSSILPLAMLSAMDYKLGKDLSKRLLTFDYLSNCDLKRHYKELFESGMPFASMKNTSK